MQNTLIDSSLRELPLILIYLKINLHGSMEVAALLGLIGLGYGVAKLSELAK